MQDGPLFWLGNCRPVCVCQGCGHLLNLLSGMEGAWLLLKLGVHFMEGFCE